MDFPFRLKIISALQVLKLHASKMLENFIAPYTSTVVNHLQNEDAVNIEKTNLDEFAMGLTTEFSAYGPTKNPWNLDYVPGDPLGSAAL